MVEVEHSTCYYCRREIFFSSSSALWYRTGYGGDNRKFCPQSTDRYHHPMG